MNDQLSIGEFDFREFSRKSRKENLPFIPPYYYSLLRHFGTQENIRHTTFLDLGSGVGNQLQSFVASYGAHVINIDLDPRVIDELKSTGADARLGSVYHIPYEAGKADGVLCSEVIDIVPKTSGQLGRLFQEVHRVLNPGGLFLQRHMGAGIPIDFPIAKGQLELLAQAGFHHIRLLETPETYTELYFSAEATATPQRLDEVLESNYDWVYRKTRSNDEGKVWHWLRYKTAIERWDKATINKSLKEALIHNKPVLLLNAIRSIIIQFWPEDRDEDTLLDTATDFDFQFEQFKEYPQWFDEEYCLKNGLDPTIARSYYEKYGLRRVIDAWKEGKPSEFSFFGRGPHERLIFNPRQKAIIYSGSPKDPERLPLKTRFYSVFGTKGLEISK